jgi:hypothetical protein
LQAEGPYDSRSSIRQCPTLLPAAGLPSSVPGTTLSVDVCTINCSAIRKRSTQTGQRPGPGGSRALQWGCDTTGEHTTLGGMWVCSGGVGASPGRATTPQVPHNKHSRNGFGAPRRGSVDPRPRPPPNVRLHRSPWKRSTLPYLHPPCPVMLLLLLVGTAAVGAAAQSVAGYPQPSQWEVTADKCLLSVESVQLYSAGPDLQVRGGGQRSPRVPPFTSASCCCWADQGARGGSGPGSPKPPPSPRP